MMELTNEEKAKNIVARFLDKTVRGNMPEEDFVDAWDSALVAIQCMNLNLPGDRIKAEGGEILQKLCAQTHPVNEKNEPYCASKAAIMFGAQEAALAICRLVAVGG